VFDDVMSALDAKVGSFIMEETILKQLKGKTVLLVTHGLQYLKYSDYIYVMDEGKMILQGKFEDVQGSELYKKFEQLDEVSVYNSCLTVSGARTLSKRTNRRSWMSSS